MDDGAKVDAKGIGTALQDYEPDVSPWYEQPRRPIGQHDFEVDQGLAHTRALLLCLPYTPMMQQGQRNHFLDILRAVAALIVCVSHLRAATLVDWSGVQSAGGFSKALYFATGLGHQAVIVFFVISGYLIGGSVLSGRFEWREYAGARLARLWTVLIPCLAFTFLVDAAIGAIDPAILAGGYAGRWHSVPEPGVYDNSALTFLGNVMFLQTITVPVFGSNGPMWSLANEFWYYALFPLLVQAAGGLKGPRSTRLVAGAFATFLVLWLPQALLFGFLVWLMGVAVHILHARVAIARSWSRTAAAGLILVAVTAYAKIAPQAWWVDLLVGLPTATLILVAPFAVRPHRGQRAVEHLSDISFSLYLSHFPLVLLIGGLAAKATNNQPTLSSWMLLALGLILLVAAAHSMWWLFERHTPAVRRLFRRGLRAVRLPAGRQTNRA